MKSSRVLSLISIGGASVVVVLAVLLARLWPHASVTVRDMVHAVAYACQVAWTDISQGQLAYTSLGAVLLFSFFGWLSWTVVRATRLAKRVHFGEVHLSPRILSIAADAGLEVGRLTIAKNERPFAMTVGIRWPEVIVSTAALTTLTQVQLRAVLEHEAHHVRQREPLRRLLLSLALLWVPFRKLRGRLQQLYVSASEVEADERVNDQRVLGSALLQLVTPPGVGAGFSPLDARVERLVNPHFRQSGAFVWRFALVALAITGVAIFFAPKSIAAVFGNHQPPAAAAHLDMCRAEHERMLQSREQSCGTFSAPLTCVTK